MKPVLLKNYQIQASSAEKMMHDYRQALMSIGVVFVDDECEVPPGKLDAFIEITRKHGFPIDGFGRK
jgi:hypothetical protein